MKMIKEGIKIGDKFYCIDYMGIYSESHLIVIKVNEKSVRLKVIYHVGNLRNLGQEDTILKDKLEEWGYSTSRKKAKDRIMKIMGRYVTKGKQILKHLPDEIKQYQNIVQEIKNTKTNKKYALVSEDNA